ncbi:hypothetical protein [Rheinheimera sp. 4Y26]|uniref:hypothetical protein n=1 Tax=Rheinheimera sp. 4Y26 TaxID=2977811 RepID=UPI0021B1461A|nr:hypothetical protein [Rheinheimera sp. 4Y26]MCT6698379.1 hypothetical protein [Rheinheimera sp. 4Y26]
MRLLLLPGAVLLIALINTPLPAAAEPASIQQICQISGQPCLDALEPKLASTPKGSLPWYELTLYKLDSLFELQKDQELFALTSQLVADKQLTEKGPAHFRARLYIYLAKLLYARKNTQASAYFLQQATTLLADLHQADFNPFTMVLLLNVQMYTTGNDEQGYAALKALEQQYRKSKDPVFLYELYNNLGHYSHRLNLLHESVAYRQKALKAISGFKQQARIAEAHYNLARSLANIGQWRDTLPHLQQAEQLYLTQGYSLLHNLAILHQAEALWRSAQQAEARIQFSRVQKKLVPDYAQAHLQRIQQLLAAPPDTASPDKKPN